MADNTFDVIIIGAGISGINAAYRLQESIPDYRYAILEGRGEIGGTWSLFKYPGIRSDSDLHTFGFPWAPWKEDRPIASADAILRYVRSVTSHHGIDKHIKYNNLVTTLDWSSKQQHWKIDVLLNGEKHTSYFAPFVLLGTGYYDYDQALPAQIPGIENFNGPVIHPQFWPENFDYSNKKVVVIGSGATAVTIVPSLAEKAERVTMLQRSPSYLLPSPVVNPIDQFIRKWFPDRWSYTIIRLRFLWLTWIIFQLCRMFPQQAKRTLRSITEKELPKSIPFDPHFVPSYSPWDQRMCITPGGDFFEALRTGKADIVTDKIAHVTETGFQLESGATLDADIIITATGLKLLFGGGSKVFVDGQPVHLGDKYSWRGALLQDIPNLTFVLGYTNASWTLGADATAQLWIRLLKQARKTGTTSIVPQVADKEHVIQVPLLNLNSTYIKSAEKAKTLPKAGNKGPWKPRATYFNDLWHAQRGNITDGLRFYRVPAN